MSTLPQFTPKRYQAGKDVVSASDLNARGQELLRLGKLALSGGSISSDKSGNQITIPVPATHRLGVITEGNGTGENSIFHSWEEIEPIGDGDYQTKVGGIVGNATLTPMQNPAHEFNGRILDAGTRIIVWESVARLISGKVVQEWMFVVAEGGGEQAVGYGYNEAGGNSAVVKITSLTKVEGYYPGKKQFYDTASNTFSDGEDIFILDLS